jgi:hypothetical protein
LNYAPAPGGKVIVKLLPQELNKPSRGLELWRIINLNARQRASLAKDLGEVLERHATAEPETGAEAFLIHAAFAPRPPST